MRSSKFLSVLAVLTVFLTLIGAAGISRAGKPTVGSICTQCHEQEDNVVRGTLVSVSEKFKSLHVAVGNLVWVINYGDDLKLTGVDSLKNVSKGKEISVIFSGDEKSPHGISLAVKPPAKIPDEKLISLKNMTELIALGPEKGGYLLYDSRPAPRYLEGHIPSAISLPQPAFDKLHEKLLPKNKEHLIIFYCGGIT